MTLAFLTQLLISGTAVAALVSLAAWLATPRLSAGLDQGEVRRLLEEEFPEAVPEQIWITSDGAGAVARVSLQALLIFRAGDGYVIRSVPWGALAAGAVKNGRAIVSLGDSAAPRAVFALADGAPWPPEEFLA